MQLKITDRAKGDLAEIEEYTGEHWGNHQTDTYMAQIEKRIGSLLDSPYLGVARSDISQGYRSLSEGQHLIFYRIEDDIIEIIGILHASMDLERHLEDKSRTLDDDERER